jgi:hypothetical protein
MDCLPESWLAGGTSLPQFTSDGKAIISMKRLNSSKLSIYPRTQKQAMNDKKDRNLEAKDNCIAGKSRSQNSPYSHRYMPSS